MEKIVILVTAKDRDEAERIATKLVEERLVACANIGSDVQSIFQWEGKVDRAQEILLILKTQKSLFEKVAQRVKSLHSYDVPEIIALPIVEGSADYLKWIEKETAR